MTLQKSYSAYNLLLLLDIDNDDSYEEKDDYEDDDDDNGANYMMTAMMNSVCNWAKSECRDIIIVFRDDVRQMAAMPVPALLNGEKILNSVVNYKQKIKDA